MARRLGPSAPERQRLGRALALSFCLHLLVLFFWQGQMRIPVATQGMAPSTPLTARFLRVSDHGETNPDDTLQRVRAPKAPDPQSAEDASGNSKQRTRVVKEIYDDLNDVDVRPWIRSRIRPEYPPPLPPGLESATVLSFVVDEEGGVRELVVDQPGSDPLFDLFALEAFAQARYTPALIGGRPVKVRMRVRVEFNSP